MAILTDIVLQVAEAIFHRRTAFITRVGIDGIDGAGKTTFANVLAETLASQAVPAIRSSVDGFHNPKAIRYRSGRMSPLGFYADSYDYARLKSSLLDPLSPGGTGRYLPAVFDHNADSAIDGHPQQANPGDVLLFDGILYSYTAPSYVIIGICRSILMFSLNSRFRDLQLVTAGHQISTPR